MSEEFAKAFLAAQREFPSVHKGRTADMGNYKYSYADLGDVLDSALPILHKHGLAISQPPVSAPGQVGVLTRLIHESGHIEDCGELLLSAGNTAQTAGSALTYARRYAACAALGIVADEDDDGQAASQPPPDLTEVIRAKVSMFKEWTEDERREVWKDHAALVEVGKPKTTADIDKVIASMAEVYFKAFPPAEGEAPF